MFMQITINIELGTEFEKKMEAILAAPLDVRPNPSEIDAIDEHIAAIGRLADDSIEDAVAALNGAGYVATLADQ